MASLHTRSTKNNEINQIGAAALAALTEFNQLPNKYAPDVVPALALPVMRDEKLRYSLGVREFEGVLGSGADSIVLGAKLITGESVALKISRPFPLADHTDENRVIFERELATLQALVRVKIPHLVELLHAHVLHDTGGETGIGVLMLSRAAGRPALELLESATKSDCSATFVRELYADLLAVAVAGAELRISFRDIDPSNAVVVVDTSGRLQQSTVVDFGQCRLFHASATEALEETLAYALKPRDMGYFT